MKYSFSYLEIPDDLYSFCYENFNNLKEEKKQLLLKRDKINKINNNYSFNYIKKKEKYIDTHTYNKFKKENKNISNNKNYIQFNKTDDIFNSMNNEEKDYKMELNISNSLDIKEKHLLNNKQNNKMKNKSNKALLKIFKVNKIKYNNALFYNINDSKKYITDNIQDKIHTRTSKGNTSNIFMQDKKISSISKQNKNINYYKLKNTFFNYKMPKNIQINKVVIDKAISISSDIKIDNNNYYYNNIHKTSVKIKDTFENNQINKIIPNISTFNNENYNYKGKLENVHINIKNTSQGKLKRNILNSNLYDRDTIKNKLQKITVNIGDTKTSTKVDIAKDFSDNFINAQKIENKFNKFYNKTINEIKHKYKNKYFHKNINQKDIDTSKVNSSFRYKESSRKIDTSVNIIGLDRKYSKNIHNDEINIYNKNKIDKAYEKEIIQHKDLLFNKETKKHISNKNKDIKSNRLEKNILKNIVLNKDIISKKVKNKNIEISNNEKKLNSQAKNIYVEDKVRLGKLHKRLWFIKGIGDIDYKILPNTDYKYPAPINIFVEKPNFEYYFEYKTFCDEYFNGEYIIELYDYDYNIISILKTNNIEEKEVSNDIISLKISKESFNDIDKDEKEHYRFEIKINHYKSSYIIIRQPTNTFDNEVLYTVTEKFLGENKHPLPFGNELGLREIPIHINIMVEFINVLLLLWQQRFVAFGGLLGIHGIYGLVNLVYEWLTLDTSIEDNEYIEEYNRCFRWLRWEAEKTYNLAKADTKLNANNWINFMLNEMIDYVEMHHIDIIPILENIMNTDDWRDRFSDATLDIQIILDKMKGKRKRVISNKKMELTNKPLDNLK